jgi:hypothetical protein
MPMLVPTMMSTGCALPPAPEAPRYGPTLAPPPLSTRAILGRSILVAPSFWPKARDHWPGRRHERQGRQQEHEQVGPSPMKDAHMRVHKSGASRAGRPPVRCSLLYASTLTASRGAGEGRPACDDVLAKSGANPANAGVSANVNRQ